MRREVKAFANANNVRFLGYGPGISSADDKSAMISVELTNATVAEIMDAIGRGYMRGTVASQQRVWIYHACRTRDEQIVELEVM